MNQANNDLGQSMRVRFSPNYFDSPRVQETCERYAFWLAKLRGLRSRGWEVKVGASLFICVPLQHVFCPECTMYQFSMECDPVPLKWFFVIVK